MAFMRAYGMGMMGDPGPKPAPKRKSAAAGPRAKAGRKRVVRSRRARRGGSHGTTSARGGLDLGAIGAKLAGGVPFVGGALEEGISQFTHRGGGPAAAGGRGRRRINPANVRALTRSLRRVERFGRLVSRVNRLLPRAHKYQVHPVLKHKRKRRVA